MEKLAESHRHRHAGLVGGISREIMKAHTHASSTSSLLPARRPTTSPFGLEFLICTTSERSLHCVGN